MKQSKTILDRIGISEDMVKQWKDRGLIITFPMARREEYFKSDEGVFVEAADMFVPPLTKEETALYTEHPEIFKRDYLRNAKLYFEFHTFLYEKSKSVEKLGKPEDKTAAILSLLYLFLSAMDHHHYHFDRYMVYQEYPETPVGFWWAKLKGIYLKTFGEKVPKLKPPERFLRILSGDGKVIKEVEVQLQKGEKEEFRETLKNIRIFEDAQQEDSKIVTGFPAEEDLLLKSGFGLWEQLCDLIREFPEVIKDEFRSRVQELINAHPIISTRETLLPSSLKYFKEEIRSEFEKEIGRWL